MRTHSGTRQAVTAGLATAAALVIALAGAPAAMAAPGRGQASRQAVPASAAARQVGLSHPRRLPAGDRAVCPAPRPGQAECASVVSASARSSAASATGYSPANLRSAYGLTAASAKRGRGETVAVVEAYRDPRAAHDLTVYRAHYGLGACLQAHGCLRIMNEHGGARLPKANRAWATDQSTGLEIISALCPRCRLLLVEASSNSLSDLGAAENTAVAKGAKFVFNGWSTLQFVNEDSYARYFNHPGVAIVAASGDSGYGTAFPADLPYVTAVGGTTLTRTTYNTRGWAETAWAGTGSGCSSLEPKPSWQRSDASSPDGCLNRTVNDVAADADPTTGAATYDSYGSRGWTRAGGTPLAAAIITAAYALAGDPAPRTYPASYPYQHARRLNDVTYGSNGMCELTRQYLCTAQRGFDGPTGLGTPHGPAAFSASGSGRVTVLDPGVQDVAAGTSIAIRVTGLDARKAARRLAYVASGLPAGLAIHPDGRSTNAVITGTLPAAVTAYAVKVTARDRKTGQVGSTWFSIVAAGSLTPSAPFKAAIATDTSTSLGPALGQCLDSGTGAAGDQVTIQPCTGIAGQLWEYLPEGAPGAPDELSVNGLCLGLAGASAQLAACNRGDATQSWRLLYGGTLENVGSGTCLATEDGYADPLSMQPCDSAIGYQQWHLIGATLQSAVPGMCLAVNDNGYDTSPYLVEPCGNGYLQAFAFNNDGSVLSSLSRCMIGGGLDGAAVSSGFCNGGPSQVWLPGPGGELVNAGSGLCLDDPAGSAAAGAQLVQEDCYGTLGEIWAKA